MYSWDHKWDFARLHVKDFDDKKIIRFLAIPISYESFYKEITMLCCAVSPSYLTFKNEAAQHNLEWVTVPKKPSRIYWEENTNQKLCKIFLGSKPEQEKVNKFVHYLNHLTELYYIDCTLEQFSEAVEEFDRFAVQVQINEGMKCLSEKHFPNSILSQQVDLDSLTTQQKKLLHKIKKDESINFICLDVLDEYGKNTQDTQENNMKEKEVVKTVTMAVEDGAKRAAIHEASEVLLDLSKDILQSTIPFAEVMYSNAQNRELLKFLVAVGVVTLNNVSPNLVPHSDKMTAMAKLVMSNSTQKVLEPHFAKLKKAAQELALIHGSIANTETVEDKNV